MNRFVLIKNENVVESVNKPILYLKAFKRNLEEYAKIIETGSQNEIKQLVIKIIIYGVKFINSQDKHECLDRRAEEQDFLLISYLKDLMGTLTPREFMNVFPIDKEYDGHKYNMKDYFSTMNYIKGFELNEPIGDEALRFVWEYQNLELTDFNVEAIECISRLNRLDGKPSLAEEFAVMMGVKTYSLNTDENEKQFLIDNETGRSFEVKKAIPRHLKILK